MKLFLKSASYLFHPLWMPLLGTTLFFIFSPKYFHFQFTKILLLGIVTLTIVIPILFLFILKTAGIIESFRLQKVKERRIPLLFFCLLTSLIINFALARFQYIELYYFFAGILLSGILCLLLSVFQIKASLHMVGISGVAMFLIGLSILYQQNYIPLIALLIFAIGWTAASRLHLKAHFPSEILLGTFIGMIPQFLLIIYGNL